MSTGRNEPCPCGSGKKYKKCCLAADQTAAKPQPVYEELEPDEIFEEDEESIYGQPQIGASYRNSESLVHKDYPAISDEEDALVDEWWTLYKEMNEPDIIREHLEKFMKNHPNLVENLGLDSEVLFELGADYRKEKRQEVYIDLLLKIREAFPAAYLRSAGYYDLDIIALLISKRQFDQIPQYFNYLIDYPVDFSDHIYELCNLLMALDLTEPLLLLANQIQGKLYTSMSDDDGILMPIVYQKFSSYFKPDYSEQDLERFVADLKENLFPDAQDERLKALWKSRFEDIARPHASWPVKPSQPKHELFKFYDRICNNFMQYLKETHGLSWISARFHSIQIYNYAATCLNEKKAHKPNKLFDFSYKRIDHIVATISRTEFFYLDSTILISTLNAIHYFAEYLVTCAMMDNKEKQQTQGNVQKLYTKVYPKLLNMNSEALCFSKFPLWG